MYLPAPFSGIEHVPVAVPCDPSSNARQSLLPSVTVTFPVGVARLPFLVNPLTRTRTETSRPATGRRVTAAMAVVVGGSHLNVEVKSTEMHETSEEHETDSRGAPWSISSGADQRPESYMSASPPRSTA